jgi:hypothetical protein
VFVSTQDGAANYLKGLMLILCYLIVAASFFFHVDPQSSELAFLSRSCVFPGAQMLSWFISSVHPYYFVDLLFLVHMLGLLSPVVPFLVILFLLERTENELVDALMCICALSKHKMMNLRYFSGDV